MDPNMPQKHRPKYHIDNPTLCSGKRRYATKQEAERVAEEQEILNFADDLELSVYRCISCGGWHLTRNKKDV